MVIRIKDWNSRFAAALPVLLGLVLTIDVARAQAQIYTVLYDFANGELPYGRLTKDENGNLYGTAKYGGSDGFGIAYKLDTSGNLSTLRNFQPGDTGIEPVGGLVFTGGYLYGTTSLGTFGCGVAFKLDLTGAFTRLHDFQSVQNTDGCVPQASMVQDATGNLYGTTSSGGNLGFGTVFKIDAAGNYSVLYNFAGPPVDGAFPAQGSLALDETGNLFGTTVSGGSFNDGAIFRLKPNGQETILHHFTGGRDGRSPRGTLVHSKGGLLLGSVPYGGSDQSCFKGCGIIIGLDSNGRGAVFHNFEYVSDGGVPAGGLAQDAAGNLYGATTVGGPFGFGAIFKLDSSGREIILHGFDYLDGSVPFGTLFLDMAGNLYGTTLYGGAFGSGVVFKVTQ